MMVRKLYIVNKYNIKIYNINLDIINDNSSIEKSSTN